MNDSTAHIQKPGERAVLFAKNDSKTIARNSFPAPPPPPSPLLDYRNPELRAVIADILEQQEKTQADEVEVPSLGLTSGIKLPDLAPHELPSLGASIEELRVRLLDASPLKSPATGLNFEELNAQAQEKSSPLDDSLAKLWQRIEAEEQERTLLYLSVVSPSR